MAKQINQYAKTRTAATLLGDDLFDVDSTEDNGTTYESAKLTLTEFMLYINQNVNTFYLSDGTLTGARTVDSAGFETTFDGGDLTVQMDNLLDDYGINVKDSLGVEKARLFFDQVDAAGSLTLSNATTDYLIAQEDHVLIGGAAQVNSETLGVDGRLQITHDNYLFNGTTVTSAFSNNLGDMLAFTDGGGINLNDYNNGLGAPTGTQNFNCYFHEYQFRGTQNAADVAGRPYMSLDANQVNSGPTSKVNINVENALSSTVLRVGLDRQGPVQVANPVTIEILDNYPTHQVDQAGVDYFKTGIRSILSGVFESTTTGNGVNRSAWFGATGGDINQALFVESGDVQIDTNIVVGNPTGGALGNGSVNMQFLSVYGLGNDNTTKAAQFLNNAGDPLMNIYNDQTVVIGDQGGPSAGTDVKLAYNNDNNNTHLWVEGEQG